MMSKLAKQATIKELTETGAITSVQIDQVIENSYVVMFNIKNGSFYMLEHSRHNKPRMFKTIDAAISAIAQCGWKMEVKYVPRSQGLIYDS
jgi:hypothetical protein